MLIPRTDTPGYLGGPLDIICILRDVTTGRYHSCFFEECPMPGPVTELSHEVKVVRLKSKMHHTEGADTLDGAKAHYGQLRDDIKIPDLNASDTPIGWDGEMGLVWAVENWTAKGVNVGEVLATVGIPIPKPITVEQLDTPAG